MSRNTKIVVSVIVAIVACCCCFLVVGVVMLPQIAVQFAETAVVEDPEMAADLGESMVDYDLPSGYAEEVGMEFFGLKMVLISGAGENDNIVMMQFPAALAGSEAEMQEQVQIQMQQQLGNANYSVEFVEDREIEINGTETTLSIFEGETDQGVAIRQMIAYFESNAGNPSILVIVGEVDNWDSAEIDAFLASME